MKTPPTNENSASSSELKDILDNINLEELATQAKPAPPTVETAQQHSPIKLAPKLSKQESTAPSPTVDYEGEYTPEPLVEEYTPTIRHAKRIDPNAPPRRRRSHSGRSHRRASSKKSSESGLTGLMKYAVIATLGIVVLLASFVVVMMMRQSSLRQEEKAAREAHAAKLQLEAQKQLSELHVRNQGTKSSTQQVTQAGKNALDGSSLNYDVNGNALYNPGIFNLPSDKKHSDNVAEADLTTTSDVVPSEQTEKKDDVTTPNLMDTESNITDPSQLDGAQGITDPSQI